MADPGQYEQLSNRWAGFLAKVKERYNEVLQQAEGPLSDTINNLQYDNIIIHNIMTALRNQTVEQLGEKVDEGWKKMKLEMEKIGASRNDMWLQTNEGGALKGWMQDNFLEYRMKIYARAARKILENVKAHVDETKMHRCTQCGAELPIRIYSFMAVNLKCESCGSVNTYQPDDRVRALEYYVLNNLADEQAYGLKLQAIFDRTKIKDYFEKYYSFIIENVPDKKEFYEREKQLRINTYTVNPESFANFARN
jgi:predicted RNA-binding Zn-ribbon protein involved in translation (DUF1610 family)